MRRARSDQRGRQKAGGDGSSFSVSFLSGVLNSLFTFTRNSNATQFGASGLPEWAPMNAVTNSSGLGGSDNTIPTGWYLAGGNGIGLQVVGYGDSPTMGAKYVDIRCVGTNALGTGTFPALQLTPGGSRPSAILGQQWSAAFNMQLLADAMGNVASLDLRAEIQETNSGVYLARAAVSFTASDLATGARRSVTRLLNNPSTNQVSLFCVLTVAAGQSVDFTFRIWAPQFELGPVSREFIPTSSGPAYMPRFDYNPVTRNMAGLLMEGQGTNFLHTSEAPASVFATSRVVTSFGSFVFSEHTGDGTAATHGGIATGVTPAASTLYTLSAVVRSISGSPLVQLTGSGIWIADPTNAYVNFNLSTGTVVQAGSAASNVKIIPLGGGYYRIAASFMTIASPGGGTAVAIFFLATGSEPRAPNNTSTATVGMGLFQMEPGPLLTSYIPTYNAIATRAADSLSVATGSWYDPNKGSMLVEWVRQAIPATALTYNPMVAILRNSATTRLAIMCGSGAPSQQRFDVVDGGATQAAIAGAFGADGTVYKQAAAWAANDFRMAQGGTLGTPDTSGTVPQGVTALELGNYGTSSPLHGHIRRFAYYPQALPDSKLQEITA